MSVLPNQVWNPGPKHHAMSRFVAARAMFTPVLSHRSVQTFPSINKQRPPLQKVHCLPLQRRNDPCMRQENVAKQSRLGEREERRREMV